MAVREYRFLGHPNDVRLVLRGIVSSADLSSGDSPEKSDSLPPTKNQLPDYLDALPKNKNRLPAYLQGFANTKNQLPDYL
jgi:hypothetical protein